MKVVRELQQRQQTKNQVVLFTDPLGSSDDE